jgi:hypothetical protein
MPHPLLQGPHRNAGASRGSSISPSRRYSANRERHLRTIGRCTPSRSAISVLFSPSAANNTIRERCASACALDLRRAHDSSWTRSCSETSMETATKIGIHSAYPTNTELMHQNTSYPAAGRLHFRTCLVTRRRAANRVAVRIVAGHAPIGARTTKRRPRMRCVRATGRVSDRRHPRRDRAHAPGPIMRDRDGGGQRQSTYMSSVASLSSNSVLMCSCLAATSAARPPCFFQP